jgi:hypothetical protein
MGSHADIGDSKLLVRLDREGVDPGTIRDLAKRVPVPADLAERQFNVLFKLEPEREEPKSVEFADRYLCPR